MVQIDKLSNVRFGAKADIELRSLKFEPVS
jgi:hypothetical protein